VVARLYEHRDFNVTRLGVEGFQIVLQDFERAKFSWT
jgi:hypothetical protein